MSRFYALLFILIVVFQQNLNSQTSIPPVCSPLGIMVPSESCNTACVTCNFTGYSGSTSGFAGDLPPSNFCSQVQNDQWFAFVAGTTSATLTIMPSNCLAGNGIQAAVYPDECNAPGPIACFAGCSGCGDVPLELDLILIQGHTYYLMIDGFSMDECDFQISVSPASAFQAFPLAPTQAIAGPATICPGGTYTYTVPQVVGAGYYTWSSSVPGVLVNGMASPVTLAASGGNSVDVYFPLAGAVGLSVTPSNACAEGTIRTKNISVAPIPPTVLPKAIICAEEAPYELPWGDIVNVSGTYSSVLTSFVGCDSMVQQTVQILNPIVTNQTRYICKGSSYSICGSSYNATGAYTEVCQSFLGCDSIVNLNLLVLNPIANITGVPVIGCEQSAAVLSSDFSPNFPGVSVKVWTKPDGTLMPGNSVIADTTGLYILRTSMTAGGVNCTVYDSVWVTSDSLYIPVALNGGTLGCTNSSVLLQCQASVFNPLYQWSGPGGFMASGQSETVTTAGTYTVQVTTAAGCSGSATAVVTQAPPQPTLSAIGGLINCLTQPFVVLSAITNAQTPGYQWTGPGNFQSNLSNPQAIVPGVYTVIVTDMAGCSNSATATVFTDLAAPVPTVGFQDSVCQAPRRVYCSAPGSNNTYNWSGPAGFTYNGPEFYTTITGTYTVTVINTVNGCSATTELVLPPYTTGPIGAVGPVTISGTACPGSTVVFAVNAVSEASQYTWTSSDPALLINGQAAAVVLAAPSGNTVSVTYPANYSGSPVICVLPSNQCFTAASEQCATVAVQAWEAEFPALTICGQNTPYTLPWGQSVTGSGNYSITLSAANGCDSTLRQTITVLQPVANIQGNALIGCGQSSVTLFTPHTPGANVTWMNETTGQIVGNSDTLVVDLPGFYQVSVTQTANGVVCTQSDTITIMVDASTLAVSAEGGVLSCNSGTLMLSSTVAVGNVQYFWTGPDGFESAIPNPVVSVPGVYTLTVTSALGCTGSATATVLPEPIIDMFYLTGWDSLITCANPEITLTANLTGSTTAYEWTGPNNFVSNELSITVNVPGTYVFRAENATGCFQIAAASVLVDLLTPVINLAYLNQPCVGVILIQASTTNGITNPLYQWTGPGGLVFEGNALDIDTSGNYALTVTNLDNGCTASTETFVPNSNLIPQISGVVVNASIGQNNGSIDITVSGGMPPSCTNGSIMACFSAIQRIFLIWQQVLTYFRCRAQMVVLLRQVLWYRKYPAAMNRMRQRIGKSFPIREQAVLPEK